MPVASTTAPLPVVQPGPPGAQRAPEQRPAQVATAPRRALPIRSFETRSSYAPSRHPQVPALSIALGTVFGESRHAAADGGERQRLFGVRYGLRHHAVGAVGELVDAP